MEKNLLTDYQLGAEIARTEFSVIWRAQRLENKQALWIIEFLLDATQDWRLIEQLTQEAEAWARLQHPGLPQPLALIRNKPKKPTRLYLVQAKSPGVTLASRLAKGYRFNEALMVQTGLRIAKLLQVLQAQKPQLVHGLLDPGHILLHDAEPRVGLLPAGSSRHRPNALNSHPAGPWLAPEVLAGKAVPGSDSYSLALSLITVLTQSAPDQLPQQAGVPQFREAAGVSEAFAELLEQMLASEPGKRPVGQALVAAFEHLQAAQNAPSQAEAPAEPVAAAEAVQPPHSPASTNHQQSRRNREANQATPKPAAQRRADPATKPTKPQSHKTDEQPRKGAGLSPMAIVILVSLGLILWINLQSEPQSSDSATVQESSEQELLNSQESAEAPASPVSAESPAATDSTAAENAAENSKPASSETPITDPLNEALLVAIREAAPERVSSLLFQGAELNFHDAEGYSPLLVAVNLQQRPVLKLLLEKGANPNLQNPAGKTPLLMAVQHKDLESARLLLAKGAKTALGYPDGRTPLLMAIALGQPEMVKLLVEQGASLKDQDHKGQNVLITATVNRDLEIASYLLSKGADPLAKNRKGKSALEHALEANMLDYVELFVGKTTGGQP